MHPGKSTVCACGAVRGRHADVRLSTLGAHTHRFGPHTESPGHQITSVQGVRARLTRAPVCAPVAHRAHTHGRHRIQQVEWFQSLNSIAPIGTALALVSGEPRMTRGVFQGDAQCAAQSSDSHC